MFVWKRPLFSKKVVAQIILMGGVLLLISCGKALPPLPALPDASSATPAATPTASGLFGEVITELDSATAQPTAEPTATVVLPDNSADIYLDLTAEATPIDRRVLGTNIPAWLGAGRTTDPTFIARTIAAGVTLIRIPGGSWSNWYDWSNCEMNNVCPWDWGVLTPTDFINFVKATGTEAIYTVNNNGTAKEAAALVAFFNGAVDDETEIGVDVRGHDWGTVGDWARLRRDHGNPEPLPVRYWEIGNEIYGGKEGMGTDCSPWGWEDVWTCDGREYVNGIGSGRDRHEGFLEFRSEMQKVDPTILVGAVGLTPQSDWSNWGNEVIEEAGEAMDFYVIHHYAFSDAPASLSEVLAQPQADWPPIMADAQAAFDAYDNGRFRPIAITEYNLFSFQDMDNEQLMTRSVNMLFLADDIGQMLQNGVSVANQWDLANGYANNGTDYGLLNADT
ncbi:MAG: alpha-L-arabinofuranosidase, partial [Anaerolineae bacterium]